MLMTDFVGRDILELEVEGRKNRYIFPMNADIQEDDNGTTIAVDMPGFKKEDIQVNLTGRRVDIRGERKSEKPEDARYVVRERLDGAFQRHFLIGYDADKEDVSAKFEDGVLTVYIPKNEKKNGMIQIS